MGIKTYNPYTPSRRHMTGSDFSEITKKTPEKSLTYSLKKNSGRNNQGKITVRHRGGGAKKKYRLIDFKRNKDGIPAKVVAIEYEDVYKRQIKYIIQKSTVGILIASQNQIYKIRQKKQGEKYNEMDDCIRYTWFCILL